MELNQEEIEAKNAKISQLEGQRVQLKAEQEQASKVKQRILNILE